MAIATMRVPTLFTAVDRFSDVVSKMTNKTTAFGKTAGSAISRVDHKINGLWGSMNSMSQLAIGGGIGGLFYYAGKDVMDYETKIASLAAVTGTKIGSMNKQIESLGKETKRSVIDIAGSFEIVGSKMSQYLKNPEALKQITKESILLAEASRMKLEPAIEALTGVLNIYGKSAEDANYIVNKLSAGEVVGSIKIPETLDLLRQFGGTARLANVQVDESVALIQALTKSLGVEGVGRGIRNLMVDLNMVGAYDKNKTKALLKAGVNMDILGDKSLSLIDRLTELKKLQGNSAAMGLFFKKTGIQTGATLFQNFDDLKKFLAMIREMNPALEQASKNNSTLSYMVDRLKDSFTNFVVTGNDAGVALKIVKGLVGWMIDNMGSLISLIMSVTIAFLAWKGIVLVISVINGVMTTFNAIMAVHRFIVLWATLTNVSYAASLWAVAAATLAAYWPLLLIAGALGVLVYSMWDSKKATDSMVGGQISSLDKGNLAWKNSTNVMEKELRKQKALTNYTKDIPANVSSITSMQSNAYERRYHIKEQAMSKVLQMPIQNDNQKLALINAAEKSSPKVKSLINDEYNYQIENLAGKKGFFDQILEFFSGSGGKKENTTLTIYAPEGYKVDSNNKTKGIEVKTTPNQGTRGTGNN